MYFFRARFLSSLLHQKVTFPPSIKASDEVLGERWVTWLLSKESSGFRGYIAWSDCFLPLDGWIWIIR